MVITNYSGWASGQAKNPAGPGTFYLSLPMTYGATAVAGDLSISQDTGTENVNNTMCVTTVFFSINKINWGGGSAEAKYSSDYMCKYNFNTNNSTGLGAFPQPNGSMALYFYVNYSQTGSGISKVFYNYSYH